MILLCTIILSAAIFFGFWNLADAVDEGAKTLTERKYK